MGPWVGKNGLSGLRITIVQTSKNVTSFSPQDGKGQMAIGVSETNLVIQQKDEIMHILISLIFIFSMHFTNETANSCFRNFSYPTPRTDTTTIHKEK